MGKLTSTLWDYAQKTYAPTQPAFYNSVTTGFRLIFPDKITTAMGRFEKTADNQEELNLVFDWNTARLTYVGNGGGYFNMFTNVLKPTFENKAYSYKLKKASIYGAAKWGNNWKGVRIMQD